MTLEEAADARPLFDRQVLTAFDADPAGQAAAVRSFHLLRAAGSWPHAVVLPAGQDPAGLLEQHGPAGLRTALRSTSPLADVVVDTHIARWADRLQWAEGQVGAGHDAARVIAALPPEHVARQVARVAGTLNLPAGEVTGMVLDAVSEAADARGRVVRRDRRPDLERDQPGANASSAARLAHQGFPAQASLPPPPGGLSTDPAGHVPPPLVTQQAALTRRTP